MGCCGAVGRVCSWAFSPLCECVCFQCSSSWKAVWYMVCGWRPLLSVAGPMVAATALWWMGHWCFLLTRKSKAGNNFRYALYFINTDLQVHLPQMHTATRTLVDFFALVSLCWWPWASGREGRHCEGIFVSPLECSGAMIVLAMNVIAWLTDALVCVE